MANEKNVGASVPQIQSYTAASCQIFPTSWVLQFGFGDAAPSQGGVVEVPRFLVGIPWTLAKAIHHIMGATIAEYEKTEGPIHVPNSVQAQLAGMLKRDTENEPPKTDEPAT